MLSRGGKKTFCIELSIETISHNKIQIAEYKGHDTIMIIFFEAACGDHVFCFEHKECTGLYSLQSMTIHK